LHYRRAPALPPLPAPSTFHTLPTVGSLTRVHTAGGGHACATHLADRIFHLTARHHAAAPAIRGTRTKAPLRALPPHATPPLPHTPTHLHELRRSHSGGRWLGHCALHTRGPPLMCSPLHASSFHAAATCQGKVTMALHSPTSHTSCHATHLSWKGPFSRKGRAAWLPRQRLWRAQVNSPRARLA